MKNICPIQKQTAYINPKLNPQDKDMLWLTIILALLLVAVSAVLYVVVQWINDEIAPRVELPKDASQAHRLSCFSLDYFEARNKFRKAAKAVPGMKVASHLVMMDDHDTGMELTIDSAILEGSNPRNVFVHTSGVHGAEGYAGSGIQIALLEKIANKELTGLAELDSKNNRPTLIFIHAVNPYGMRHNRRFNQDNVDLNRACITDPALWKELLARDPNGWGYEDFRHIFDGPIERKQPPSLWDMALYIPRFIPLVLWHGIPKLKRVLVTGQYHHSGGLYYGGRGTPRNWQIVKDILAPSFAIANNVLAIDVHSGLGDSGVDTILCENRKEYDTSCGIWPSGVKIDCPDLSPQGGGVASGYDDARGGCNMAQLTPDKKPAAKFTTMFTVCQEFGTRSPLRVAAGVMLENQAFHICRHTRLHLMTQQHSRGSFYVETIEWKESVRARGVERFEQTLQNFFAKL